VAALLWSTILESARAPNITIPWECFGMITYAPIMTDGKRRSMLSHHDSTINPATENTVCHRRSRQTVVRGRGRIWTPKYAPDDA